MSSRKICQLEFLKRCLENPSVEYLLQTRGSRYDNQQQLVDNYNKNVQIPNYFGPWLSGFIEAEGCFSSTLDLKLVIGQNYDWYLLNAIKMYFNSTHKIRLNKDSRPESCQWHYVIAMGGHPTLVNIVSHITKYPLLGYKKVAYDQFYEKFLALRITPKLPFLDLQEQYIDLTKLIPNNYLKVYFVGFFEGTGSIHFVKGRQLSQPHLRISLKHNLENESLLRLISHHIGGNVTVKSTLGK